MSDKLSIDTRRLRAALAAKMAAKRAQKKMSQAALAKAVGMTRAYIGKVESSGTNVSLDTLERIRVVLWLGGESPERYKDSIARGVLEARANGVSQERLAEIARVSVPYVSAVERALTNTSLDQIEQLADALKVDPLEWFDFGDLDD